ncbi:MAG: hypothetical protein KAI47_27295 [Deltaproteobacteria bacterium]|nr:hypothetical protein [Deltaproteobacteria bacterium]
MRKMLAGLTLGVVALTGVGLAGVGLAGVAFSGCAAQQTLKFDTLNKRDKLRYAACRHKVARNVCPDDPDCTIKAAELYAKEPSSSRLQWLIDYGCTKDILIHVDETVRKSERRSIGME